MEYRFSGSFLREVDGGMLRFRISSDGIDRHGSIISQEGLDTSRHNGGFYWAHDTSGGFFGPAPDIENVLGKGMNHARREFTRQDGTRGMGTEIDVLFASEINDRAEKAKRLVKAGFLGQTSIGFRPTVKTERKKVSEIGGSERYPAAMLDSLIDYFPATELLEASLVPVPSNPDADAIARALAGQSAKWQHEPQSGNWSIVAGGHRLMFPAESIADLIQCYNATIAAPAAPPPDAGADIGIDEFRSIVRDWAESEHVRRITAAAARHA